MKGRASIYAVMVMILALLLFGCQPNPDDPVRVSGVTLSLSAQTLPPGTQYQLQATVLPPDASDKSVTWTSSAPEIASVNAGLVQALAEGAATIIVTTHEGGFVDTCAVTVQSQVIPPPPGLTGPVLAALYDGTTVRLWDGTNTVDWRTGYAVHGNGRKIAVADVLYFLDADGAITNTIYLPALPAGVTVIGDPVTYTFENITNAEAFAIDWTPPAAGGNYTRTWRDGAEYGDWHANAWTYVRSFEAGNGDVIAVDNVTAGRFHDINRPELDFTHIMWAEAGGPIFYVPDFSHQTTITAYDAAHPDGFTPAWTGGNEWSRVPWIEIDGIWYNGWGDKWDGSTFYARSTALTVFNSSSPPSAAWQSAHEFDWPDWSEGPIVIRAYVETGNVHFIETTTGTLWSWSPQTDVISSVLAQLYPGDGKSATGDAKAKTLKPEWVAGAMYYHDAGTLWRRDNASTIISLFSADQQMWVMK